MAKRKKSTSGYVKIGGKRYKKLKCVTTKNGAKKEIKRLRGRSKKTYRRVDKCIFVRA